MQVPLLIRYPGQARAGQRSGAFIDVGVDTPVTLLDLAGAAQFTEANGQSYVPTLTGGAGSRDRINYQTFRMDDGAWGEFTPVPERGIRTKDWVYVRQPNRRKLLFDQRVDPHELNNLAGSGDHVELMDAFDAEIDAHMAATGDDWDLHANFPPPDFLTHETAKTYLEEILLPNAIEVP